MMSWNDSKYRSDKQACKRDGIETLQSGEPGVHSLAAVTRFYHDTNRTTVLRNTVLESWQIGYLYLMICPAFSAPV